MTQPKPQRLSGHKASKTDWNWILPDGYNVTTEIVQTGCLQRIAAALDEIVLWLRYVDGHTAGDVRDSIHSIAHSLVRLAPRPPNVEEAKAAREEASRRRAYAAYLRATGAVQNLATDFEPTLPSGILFYLGRVGIKTLDDLTAATDADLLKIPRIGPTTVRTIRRWLAALLTDPGD